MRRVMVGVSYIIVLLMLVACGRGSAPDRELGEVVYRATGTEAPAPSPAVEVPPVEAPEPSPDPAAEAEPSPTPYDPYATPPPLVDPPGFYAPEAPPAPPADVLVWNISPRAGGVPPVGSHTAAFLRPFSARYRGAEVMQAFLTFELTHETGQTAHLLDVLEAQGVPAAFFLTLPYIENNEDMVQRMISEGHVVALRSFHFLPEQTAADISDELLHAMRHFSDYFGRPIDPFLRPAGGAYSEASLLASQHYGFFTVFWSALHYDWATADRYAHAGMVLSLHGMNAANIEALPGLFSRIQGAGFSFETLYALI